MIRLCLDPLRLRLQLPLLNLDFAEKAAFLLMRLSAHIFTLWGVDSGNGRDALTHNPQGH